MTAGVPPPTEADRPLTTAFSILDTVLRPRAMLPPCAVPVLAHGTYIYIVFDIADGIVKRGRVSVL